MGITSCCFLSSIQLINVFLEVWLSLDIISQGGGKVIIPGGVWEVSGSGAGLMVTMVVLGGQLDWMILKVSSNLGDFMIMLLLLSAEKEGLLSICNRLYHTPNYCVWFCCFLGFFARVHWFIFNLSFAVVIHVISLMLPSGWFLLHCLFEVT